jgi:hypothetical protein
MGIDDNAWLTKGVSKNDIRSLSANARQRNQLIHRARNLFTEALGHSFSTGDEMFRFVLKETGGMNDLFEFRNICRGQLCRLPVSPEERWRDLVDSLIGALGREDRGHKQFPGGAMVKFHLWGWHSALKRLGNLSETLLLIQGWQRFHYHGWYQNGLIVQRVKG